MISAIKDFIVVKFAQMQSALRTRPANLLRLFDATPVPLAGKIRARLNAPLMAGETKAIPNGSGIVLAGGRRAAAICPNEARTAARRVERKSRLLLLKTTCTSSAERS